MSFMQVLISAVKGAEPKYTTHLGGIAQHGISSAQLRVAVDFVQLSLHRRDNLTEGKNLIVRNVCQSFARFQTYQNVVV